MFLEINHAFVKSRNSKYELCNYARRQRVCWVCTRDWKKDNKSWGERLKPTVRNLSKQKLTTALMRNAMHVHAEKHVMHTMHAHNVDFNVLSCRKKFFLYHPFVVRLNVRQPEVLHPLTYLNRWEIDRSWVIKCIRGLMTYKIIKRIFFDTFSGFTKQRQSWNDFTSADKQRSFLRKSEKWQRD